MRAAVRLGSGLRLRLRLGIGLGCLLASCAAGPDAAQRVANAQAALDAAPLCCAALASARRVPLPTRAAAFQVDARSQVYRFKAGKAYFVLFEMPPYARPYSIALTSLASGALTDMTVFMPRIALFDADFQPTRAYDEKMLRSRGNNVELTVFVNPANAGERYIAVYGADTAPPVERAVATVSVTPVVVGRAVMNVYGGQDAVSVLRSAPVGSLQLDVMGLDSSVGR